MLSNSVPSSSADISNIDPKLRDAIKTFVDNVFNEKTISLEQKAQFGLDVRSSDARLLFAMFVDEYRVYNKRVSENLFYSLAQYFSIVLLECLLGEDFRPAKIIMNLMFTYYYEPNCDKRQTDATINQPSNSQKADSASETSKVYLYQLLKDQEIFKSIRFWTSAFYESIMTERMNHPVFVEKDVSAKLDQEKRIEELNCSKNITFGLLGSFIYNMSLLDLSPKFCQEFLSKHSTIAGLPDDQVEILRSNIKTMYDDKKPSNTPLSRSEKLAALWHKIEQKMSRQDDDTTGD